MAAGGTRNRVASRRTAEFRENVAAAVDIAGRTGCTRLNAPYGLRVPGAETAEQDAVAIENLSFAAQAAAKAGASVLVEAINSVDIPGFPVDSAGKALAVIEKVGAPNIGFLADLYHLAKMGEDVADVLSRYQGSLSARAGRRPPRAGGTGNRDRRLRAAVPAAGRPGVRRMGGA